VDLGVFASDLSNALWIATDRATNVYVTEYTGNRIRKFAPNGDSLLTITTTYTPGGVAVATDGTIYVAHYDAGRIHHYSASGVDLGIFASYAGCDTGCGTDFIKFGTTGDLYVADVQPIGRVRLISTAGVDLGDFVNTNVDRGVEGLGFDASGNLYVSNFNNAGSCILEKFSPSGDDLGPFAAPVCYGFTFDGEGNLYWAASGGPIV
jgi:streptogramin lyase